MSFLSRQNFEKGNVHAKNENNTLFQTLLDHPSFFQHSLDLLSIISLDGRFKQANPEWQTLLGYSEKELQEKPIINFIHPDDCDRTIKAFENLAKSQKLTDFENRVRSLSGNYRWISWNAVIAEDKYIYAVCHDVTEHKLSEMALNLLYDLTICVAKSKTASQAFTDILKIICENFNWSFGELWLLDPERKTMFIQNSWFDGTKPKYALFKERSKSFSFKKNEGLLGQVWVKQHCHWVAFIEDDPNFLRASIAKEAGFKSAIAFPICAQSDVIGVAVFLMEEREKEDYSIKTLLDTVGSQLGEFILRKEAEKKASLLASIVESSGNAIIGKDLQGTIISWNEGATRLYLYHRDEIIGKKSLFLYPEDRQDEIDLIHQKAIKGECLNNFETVRICKGGRLINVSLNISPIKDIDGKIIGFSTISYDITSRKQMESELKRVNTLQRAILDSAIYMVISTDSKGIIQIFNKSAEQNLGYRAEELVGKFTPVVLHDINEIEARALALSKELGESIPADFSTFIIKAKTGIPDENEWTFIRKDGSRFPVLLCVTALFNQKNEITGFVGVIRDLSEQKKFQKAIQEGENRFSTLVKNALDSVITTDNDGIIQSFNQASEKIFRYSMHDILGKNVKSLLDDAEASTLLTFLSKNDVGEFNGISKEILGKRKNGEFFSAEISISQVVFDGLPWFIWIIRDITERKKLDRLKDEFVSMVSHELRTPLTSIKGSLSLILGGKSGPINPQTEKLLEIALRNSNRLAAIVNDILDIEKIEAGSLVFNLGSYDLIPLIRSSVEFNKPFAEQSRVDLEFQEDFPSLMASVDPQRLIQVLTNLLSNAIKFSPQGSKVIIKAENLQNKIRISVIDQGFGIPEEFHSRIFQKFVQVDSSDQRKKGGAGLGLNISKMIIEKFGGTIGFKSEINKGSTFFIDLNP